MTLRYGGKTVKAYNYSDLKGPAPDGYHVPTAAEWQGLYNILEGLSGNGTGIWTQYLHVPLAGALYLNGQLYYDGNYFYLWSSTGNSTYQYDATCVEANAGTSAALNDRGYKERGYNIRCFKNEFVVPTSNWTVSYGTLGSGGIFWNQTVGIISITADGTTGYTIQDKNLGATTVYNSTDTRTAANCGNYYQRGNNYGFARTGATNYDTTAVDASSYGPGNYYSSSTFIETGGDWASPSNNNLRGGTTGEYDTPAEIKERYYGGKHIYRTQGPAPTGYHVPVADEYVELVAAMTALGINTSNGNCMKTYLKMPIAGYRVYSSGEVNAQDSNAYYWSATADNSFAYYLVFHTSGLYPKYSSGRRSSGYSIRCFKDTPVVPNSSWTILYNGSSVAAGAGIFHNTTDGLISISSDGQTRITIQDKNLGATTVYNSGNTLSEANCGKYYQWGNNYGFAWTGTVTTSGTQVNAGNYGPGNRYSSGTFITASYDWSSVRNDDLRGGVEGRRLAKVLKVYYGSTMVRPKIPDYLCFTADAANAGIKLTKNGNPTSVNFETSTDGVIWSDYSIGAQITLSAVGDKIYFRNKSETVTNFSTSTSNYYRFILSGDIKASGDCNYLLCKYSTKVLPNNYCFAMLFYNNGTYLKTPPKLPAEKAPNYCYYRMFRQCSAMVGIPKLPATTIGTYSYREMFYYCSGIKLSATQTGNYQQPYRLPTEGTGTGGSNWNNSMLTGTGGAYQSNPTINTTYYVHTDNIIV